MQYIHIFQDCALLDRNWWFLFSGICWRQSPRLEVRAPECFSYQIFSASTSGISFVSLLDVAFSWDCNIHDHCLYLEFVCLVDHHQFRSGFEDSTGNIAAFGTGDQEFKSCLKQVLKSCSGQDSSHPLWKKKKKKHEQETYKWSNADLDITWINKVQVRCWGTRTCWLEKSYCTIYRVCMCARCWNPPPVEREREKRFHFKPSVFMTFL